jgi:UDP-N-acetylmuramate dehydrogenase
MSAPSFEPPQPRPESATPNWARELRALRPAQVELNVPLADLTTLRIGGPAAAVCRIETVADAVMFQTFTRARRCEHYILGGGSNVLADDAGFAGVIFKIATRGYDVREKRIVVGAGLEFDTLIARSLADDLVGLEFASGIPGSVGGALVGNAGCYGHEIGEFLVDATVLFPDGRLETVGPDAFGFGYRETRLRESGALVLAATLQLRRGDVRAALAEREERIEVRRRRHPTVEPCAGSWFKNLPPSAPGENRRAAGALLDAAGAKRLRVGGAAVFPGHANIIVNVGRATSRDVRALVAGMRRAVQDRFGYELEEEVRHLPPRVG